MSADLRNQEASLAAVGAGSRADKLASITEPEAHASLPVEEVERIVQSRHNMPFRVLGPHLAEDGRLTVIRAFLPQAERVILRLLGENADEHEMRRLHADGLFESQIAQLCEVYEYIVIDASGARRRVSDAYRFRSFRFSEADERLFVQGRHFRLFEKLGARPATRGGVSGVEFAVWAPNAGRVSVVGNFNDWDGRRHPMQRTAGCGVWELFVPDVRRGALYKYEMKTPEGAVFVKADPFAVLTELPPNLASIVDDPDRHVWRDEQWMRNGRAAAVRERGVHACPSPMPAVLHGRMDDPRVDSLLAEIAAAGYTFVELPDPDGGRKGASPFTFGPPFASPGDLMAWVDACHRHRLGVLLPDPGAIFPAALSHLAWFDGTQLYEDGGAEGGLAFNLAKGEVLSFLLSNAAFWLDRYHIDSIRTDSAGAALLGELLPYARCRVPGFWLLVRDESVGSTLSAEEISRIVTGRHADPFSVLGLQRVAMQPNEPSEAEPEEKPQDADLETVVVRAILPVAVMAHVLPANSPGSVYEMRMIDDTGLFEARLPEPPADYRLRVFEGGGASREIIDPYGIRDFNFGAHDQHLFGAGNHYRIYERLGAHLRTVDGVSGVGFAVWAPNAEGVAVVGPFNDWNGLVHQMKRHGVSGVWETFVPGGGRAVQIRNALTERTRHPED
jgi:1,4-alpha-glucan branching enzyme